MIGPKPNDNRLLAALSPGVQARLFRSLELTKLELYARLHDCHRTARYVYFPTHSVVTLQCLSQDGVSIALTTVGNEGMVGINCILAEKSTNFPVQVQSAGFAYRLPKAMVKAEFDRRSEFKMGMLRYTHSLLNQIAQTAVCNRHHSLIQRFCRWLLISLDRVSGTKLTMTQEFISHILGVRREGVSESAATLQGMGVITYSRGLINVLDRAKLKDMACECYYVDEA